MAPSPQFLTTQSALWTAAEEHASKKSRGTQILKGREAILAARPMLQALAARCGQAGEVESLAYFLSTAKNLQKTPYLLLLRNRDAQDEPIFAAVLIYEYRIGMAGIRVFATGDSTGRRNVWAPPAARARVAAQAATILMKRGAHAVQIVYPETHVSEEIDRCADESSTSRRPHHGHAQTVAKELRTGHSVARAGSWALLEREIAMYLPLYPTMDETLARIGQRTRSNLRYYRRRSEKDLGCTFVHDIALRLEELQEFNRRCAFAVDETLLRWRFDSLAMDGVFLHGIRDRDGRWLSLVGGRRHNGFVEIDWQMNRVDLPSYSLSLVMRAYLIEHEIKLGATRLYIEGGSVHAIMKSFLTDRIGELTVKRRSCYVWALERIAKRVLPPKNYLGQTLTNPELNWHGFPEK